MQGLFSPIFDRFDNLATIFSWIMGVIMGVKTWIVNYKFLKYIEMIIKYDT